MKTQKTYITFLLFLLVGTSLAQVAVGIKVNNPLLYGSSPGAFESNSGLEISRSGNWGIINAGAFVRIPLKKRRGWLPLQLSAKLLLVRSFYLYLYRYACFAAVRGQTFVQRILSDRALA